MRFVQFLFFRHALAITPEQYGMLMQGLEIVARKPIRETQPTLLC